jgi:hypothetical protein
VGRERLDEIGLGGDLGIVRPVVVGGVDDRDAGGPGGLGQPAEVGSQRLGARHSQRPGGQHEVDLRVDVPEHGPSSHD